MIRHVLQSIDGVVLYPLVSLFLFLASFAYVIFSVVRMKPAEVDHASRLPLDDSPATNDAMNVEARSGRIGE